MRTSCVQPGGVTGQKARRESLNEEYLERAKAKVDDVRLLINAAAQRAAELARGGPDSRPLVPVKPDDDRSYLDIALLEIAEEKLLFTAIVEDEE